jgi:hypothetical protein
MKNKPTRSKTVREAIAEQLSDALPRANKFSAIRTKVGNLSFDSRAEARRYGELRLLEQQGTISCLKVHTRFALHVRDCNGVMVEIGHYEDDSDYRDEHGHFVVEDVKSAPVRRKSTGRWFSTQTDLFKWKQKHFEAEYGIRITIVEVKSRRRRR